MRTALVPTMLLALLVPLGMVAQDPDEELPPELQLDGLSGDMTPPEQNSDPLADLIERMTDVTKDLDGLETGRPVQKKQARIVEHLDALIAQLEESG